jgi:uncharacterized protein (DUF58 family)
MKLSREGKRFFLTTFLIGFAALNTGNNLIYLIFSLMLSLTVLSFSVLILNLFRLNLKVSAEQPAFAKKPFNIFLTLKNDKRIPSYSIWVRTTLQDGRVYFPEVRGNSYEEKAMTVTCGRRGVYGYSDFYLESSFPFLFLLKWVIKNVKGEVYVYPEIKDVRDFSLELFSISQDMALSKRYKGEDFSFVREFRYGDDWRKIHWKSSAKLSKIMVKDSLSQETKKITLIVDNLEPQDDEIFEKAISFTASLACKFIDEEYFVRLVTGSSVTSFGSGKDHLFRVLDELTILKKQKAWGQNSFVEQEGFTILVSGSYNSSISNILSISDSVIYVENI